MNDKYEEFKKWFNNNDKIRWYSVTFSTSYTGNEPFNEFEKELKEKEKERQVKSALLEIIHRNIKPHTVCVDIDRLYHELKDVGILK